MGGLPPITALKRVSVALMSAVHGCDTYPVEGSPRRPSMTDMGLLVLLRQTNNPYS